MAFDMRRDDERIERPKERRHGIVSKGAVPVHPGAEAGSGDGTIGARGLTAERRVAALLDQHGQQYQLRWELSGNPFLTEPGTLRAATTAAIATLAGQAPEESTSGGTSDGRFIAPSGCQVVELGPVNTTIHKVNECVAVADLLPLADMYETIVGELLDSSSG